MGGKKPSDIQLKINPKLQALAESSLFVPKSSQKKAKHLILDKWDGVTEMTCDRAVSICGNTSIRKWWSEPGFREWLFNEDSMRARINYLTELSLDSAEDILIDPEAPPAAKVNMIKVVLAFRHVMEQATPTGPNFENMDKQQLLNLIREKVKQIAPIIDAEQED